jgi:ketosteroid isomerase-like protein
MSEENVQVVKRGYAAFDRGDLDGVLELLDPELKVSDPFGFSTTDAYEGHGGFAQTVRDAMDAFERYEVTADEFIDAGDDVVVSARLSGIGRESGAVVNMHVFHVWTVRDGKAVLGQTFQTRNAALEAAGLPDEPAP